MPSAGEARRCYFSHICKWIVDMQSRYLDIRYRYLFIYLDVVWTGLWQNFPWTSDIESRDVAFYLDVDNEVVLLRQAIVSPQLVLLLLLRDEIMGEQKGPCIKGQLLNFNLNHQIGRDYLSIKILSMSQDLIIIRSICIYVWTLLLNPGRHQWFQKIFGSLFKHRYGRSCTSMAGPMVLTHMHPSQNHLRTH